jgi:diaminohydroxyphosphoribosylaminopyrimidine deaminase/5-amino-6-(5-phosphoribosylamino)uracil reductase
VPSATRATELDAMRRAVGLAERGLGRTSPNPVVGAVVLASDGTVVGEGFHAQAGGPHAEVVALADAGRRARGATVVVTLEPCAHTGRTGPCTQALIDADVARVVYAVSDPTAAAAGGAGVLQAAGIEVESGLLAAEAAAVNEAWLHAERTGLPFVTWKYASTLDGRIAAPDGTSRWISGAESRAEVHRLRAQVDAVMVGTGTVLVDDPELTARAADGTPHEHQPLRVVVGSRTIPPTAKVRDESVARTLFVDGEPAEVLRSLHAEGVRSVLLEGGPTLAGALLRAGLVDQVVAYLAPTLLGAGLAAVTTDVATLTDATALTVTDVTTVGGDVRITARTSSARNQEH